MIFGLFNYMKQQDTINVAPLFLWQTSRLHVHLCLTKTMTTPEHGMEFDTGEPLEHFPSRRHFWFAIDTNLFTQMECLSRRRTDFGSTLRTQARPGPAGVALDSDKMPADTMQTTDQTRFERTQKMLPVPADDAAGEDIESVSSLADNLSIWIDGEEHWISGVDPNTTCADLICALLSYQDDPPEAGPPNADPLKPTANVKQQEYAIVQKQRHYEEYLDGSARLFDVISNRHASPKEECQLQLRHLATSSARKHTPTTDKDSGMGSPVDSSRSMRFRRRGKHKVLPSLKVPMATDHWGGETRGNNPKQPKRSRKLQQRNCHMTPNESLLTIILAQDETILQQMSMLHEKDRQILKIEEEKHRVRERELGKNYLLETYLKDLDEPQAIEEVDEDEPDAADVLLCTEDDYRADPAWTPSDVEVKDEIRVYWLEKIHAVNKQLQREEELLLSLHAKVRRHQVKRAYQTKSEVMLQIDRLDTELSTQVADIHRVERKLFTANEQLKAKLGVLECLGREFETTVAVAVAPNDTQREPTATATDATEEVTQADKVAKLIQSSMRDVDDLRISVKLSPVLEAGENPRSRNPNRCLSPQELAEKNLNVRHVTDKGLTKQMFTTSIPTSPAVEACRSGELEPRGAIPLDVLYGTPLHPALDLQHLGTLV
ncbi:ras association domain-containing protein 10 isoform X1 [Drosophila subobscura]|uniref:ras association domain-containing protein 10 isoform X1 n=1 Tax=Drosophila subobscura TaxID=7241 RepID=UPI00155A8B22|nr:ras association domain-containing protein 10 isoform X1 [Drosophila subobscura]